MSRKVRVATVSFLVDGRAETKAGLYDQAFEYLEAAAGESPDLILLPELFETRGCREWRQIGQVRDPEARREATLEFAADEDGPEADRFCAFAFEHGLTVVSNNLIRSGGQLFNQATFYGREGKVVGRYRKVQPTPHEYEVVGISAGDELRPVEVDGVRYGVFICNDQAFPEICQIYALQGVDVLLHPTQAAGPTETIRSEMLRTRAHDTSCFLVISTYLQDQPLSWQYRESRAAIYDFNGFPLADTGYREGHASATLDVDERRLTSWSRDADHGETMRRQLRADLFARYYAELALKKENMIPPGGAAQESRAFVAD